MFKMDDFDLDAPMTPPPTPTVSYSSIHYGLDYLEYQFIYRPPEPKRTISGTSSEMPALRLPHTLYTLYPDECEKSRIRYAADQSVSSSIEPKHMKSSQKMYSNYRPTILDFMKCN